MGRLREIEPRLHAITEFERQIGTYGKTLAVYKQYKSLPPKKQNSFYEANRSNIALHQAARKHFDSLKLKNLPKISELKQEYAALADEKKKPYRGYAELKDKHHTLLVTKGNAERLLDIDEKAPGRCRTRAPGRADSYSR